MKKLFSSVLLISILFCQAVLPLNAQAADRILFSDDFEGYDLGSADFIPLPVNSADSAMWSALAASADSRVDVYKESETNKVLRIARLNSGSGGPRADYIVQANDMTNVTKLLLKYKVTTANKNNRVQIFGCDINGVLTGTGQTLVDTSANTTQEVVAVIDLNAGTNGKFTTYRDGALSANGTDLTSTLFYHGKIMFRFGGLTIFAGDAAYYDNISLTAYSDANYSYTIANSDSVDINDKIELDFNTILSLSGSFTVTASDILIKDSDGNPVQIGFVTKSLTKPNGYDVSFTSPLKFSEIYSVSFPNLTDLMGRPAAQMQFKTRDAVFTISDPKLSVNGNVIQTLQAGNVESKITVYNEAPQPYETMLMTILYDADGYMEDISCSKVSVGAETTTDITTNINIINPAGRSAKVFVWDNLGGMKSLMKAKSY